MPRPFVQLTPDLERACRDTVVLTTTERLRRNLIRAYDRAQQEHGHRAWLTPRIQTIDEYLVSLHRRIRIEDPRLPGLLGPEAEYQLFRATAPHGATRLVPLAQQAWQLCQQWRIERNASAFSATENGRTFLDWSDRIVRRLQADHAVTRAELPGLDLLLTDDGAISCVAFEQTPTTLGTWLASQISNGCRVDFLPEPSRPPAEVSRCSFDTVTDELAAVAHWARSRLSEPSGERCVGIVVPDLATRYTSVLRQFTAEFDPMLDTNGDLLVDVGGGLPLGDQPVWRAASNWLTFCYEGLAAGDVHRLLEDAYLDLPRLGVVSSTLPDVIDLAQLARQTGIRELRDRQRQLPAAHARPTGEWLRLFAQLLDAAGWNGRRAGSHQYQAFQQCRGTLEAMAISADNRAILPGVLPGGVIRLLNDYLATVVFAPERPPAPIQIMGYLETTGLRFTDLWIMGLDDQRWPQPLRLNPFIPARARREHLVPRSSQDQEVDFARERLSHWRAAADRLIVSHARHSEDTRLRPSPLIRSFPETGPPSDLAIATHPYFLHTQGQVEALQDPTGHPLDPGAQSGGTARIRDQALCPFRGYAVHRLGLREERAPHGLPDALDRGVLIHDALYRLYRSADAARQTPADLGIAEFTRASEQALQQHYRRFPAAFLSRELQRLTTLLGAWNRLESQRSDSTIESLELEVQTDLDQIGLRLRIDRIDRIGEALFVIDYKTGRVGRSLSSDRLVDPQLPLYALTNEAITGVLYAEIDDTRPRLKGVSEVPVEQAALQPPAGGSWETQRRIWRGQLENLTGEIRRGFAAVAPHDGSACQNCHLGRFCRINLGDGQAAGNPNR